MFITYRLIDLRRLADDVVAQKSFATITASPPTSGGSRKYISRYPSSTPGHMLFLFITPIEKTQLRKRGEGSLLRDKSECADLHILDNESLMRIARRIFYNNGRNDQPFYLQSPVANRPSSRCHFSYMIVWWFLKVELFRTFHIHIHYMNNWRFLKVKLIETQLFAWLKFRHDIFSCTNPMATLDSFPRWEIK